MSFHEYIIWSTVEALVKGLLPHPHMSHTLSHQYASTPGPHLPVHILTLNLRFLPQHCSASMQGI